MLHAGHPAALENLMEDVSIFPTKISNFLWRLKLPADNKYLHEHKNFIFYTSILDEVHYNRFRRVHNIYEVTNVSSADMSIHLRSVRISPL